jgi:hypothetical protein
MKNNRKVTIAVTIGLVLCSNISAQSGGSYVITQSVVSNGGGTSDGGPYSVTGTAAQALAGSNSSSAEYGIRGGFWQSFLTPTAALVSVSGQVLQANGLGISQALVTLSSVGSAPRAVRTNSFGYFRFEDVEAGQTCIVSVLSSRYQFTNQTQSVFVVDEVTDLTFTALPE